MGLDRREFIKRMAMLLATYSLGGLINSQDLFAETQSLTSNNFSEGMPTRNLGQSGLDVSLFSLGGQATLEQPVNEEKAIEIINRALDLGVNYIDTAPSYGDGISETYIGQVMQNRREEVFLATKTHNYDYDGTMSLIESSLERLQTDYLDLYQLHSVRTEADLREIFASHGAIKALEELKSEGVIENIGITGHRDPDILLRGIQEYDFDCLLMTLNAADIHYKPFQNSLLNTAVEKDLGIIAMKIPAHGRIFQEGGLTKMEQALCYTLTFPVSTAIVGISTIEELEENVEIAKNFEPLTNSELAELEALTESYQREGNFFKYHW